VLLNNSLEFPDLALWYVPLQLPFQLHQCSPTMRQTLLECLNITLLTVSRSLDLQSGLPNHRFKDTRRQFMSTAPPRLVQ
jgi:hypothetical protein